MKLLLPVFMVWLSASQTWAATTINAAVLLFVFYL